MANAKELTKSTAATESYKIYDFCSFFILNKCNYCARMETKLAAGNWQLANGGCITSVVTSSTSKTIKTKIDRKYSVYCKCNRDMCHTNIHMYARVCVCVGVHDVCATVNAAQSKLN